VIEDAEDGARVVVQIPAMPSYVEQMLIDKLERKLSLDHGAPREPKKPAPEEKKPTVPEGDKKPSEDAPPDGDGEPRPALRPRSQGGARTPTVGARDRSCAGRARRAG
jgi:hypothetical protein